MFSKERRNERSFQKHTQRELKTLCRGGDHPFLSPYTAPDVLTHPSRAEVKIVPFFLKEKAPVVLCCPGGAYAGVSWINEGYDIARALNERGFSVLLLRYRTGPRAKNGNPPADVAAAMQWLRDNADKYRLDAENVFLCGFSAGGHLAAYYAATAKKNGWLCPKALVLGYPVISLETETHGRTRQLFLGKHEHNAAAQRLASVEQIADAQYPPTFTMHCEDDTCVPSSNSLRLKARLDEVGVPCECALYPTGGHGCGLGKTCSADGWIDRAADFLKQYTE